MANILIIGSGAFGTALSQPLIENNHNVYFYSKKLNVENDLMNGKHKSFPNSKILAPKMCFNNYEDTFQIKYNVILLCVPSKSLNSIYDEINKFLNSDMIIVNTAKGLNPNSEHGIWSDLFAKNKIGYALIVGPSFAEDLINRHKTIINIISKSIDISNYICSIFNNSYFKLIYFDNEYIASFVSSFKNSLAIGLGLVTFLDDSINTQTAFLTIGLIEIKKLIYKLTNKNDDELLNFFGVGDVILTCRSDMSRNYKFGYQLGKNGILNTIKNFEGQTVEGFKTIELIHKYIQKYNLELPLFSSLYDICYKYTDPKEFLDIVWNKIK